MAEKCLIFVICLCLLLTTVAVYQAHAETLDEYKERIKKEQEEAEKKKKDEEEKKKKEEQEKKKSDDHSACFGCLDVFFQAALESGCLQSLFSGLFSVLSEARYADYPFSPGRGFDFSAYPEKKPGAVEGEYETTDVGGKFWMGELGAGGSCLFGQADPMFDGLAFCNLDVTIFHLSLFYQYLWDAAGAGLNTFSANAGFSLPLGNFIISFYGGVFWQQGFSAYVSFGASGRFFIPGGFIISLASLFSFYDPFFFIVLAPAAELALGRFTVGVGFNWYDYNNLILYGPAVKAAVWF